MENQDRTSQDNAELLSKGDSQISRHRPFGYEVAQWLRAFRFQWIGRYSSVPDQEKPNFGKGQRFLIAFFGSMTFWFVGFILYIIGNIADIDRQREIGPQLDFIGNAFPFILLLTFGLSIWFAWLISWKNNQFGPIRLYLSALLLSAFVFEVISRVWPQ